MGKVEKIKSGYKPSPFGPIPLEWEMNSLADWADVKGRVGWKGYKTEDLRDSGPLVIGASHIDDNNKLNLSEPTFLSKEKYDESPEIFVKKNDIVFVQRGSLGKVALIDFEIGEATINPSMVLLKSKKPSLLYLYYYLSSFLTARNIYEVKGATGVPMLSQEQIADFRVISPQSPKEQIAIANLLGTWDKSINTLTQLIAQKELRKKWLMQQLLSGKKRLKGFKEKWKKIGAGDVFQSVSIKGNLTEQLLSATQDKGMIPRDSLEGRVTMPSGDTGGFKLVEVGDFVISLRSFQGGLEYSYYRGLVSPAYTVLKPKVKISDEFYKQYFKSYDFIGHLSIAVIGIRDGKNISYDDFCTVRIPCPSIEEQTAIARVLQAADAELKLLNQKLDKLKEQKRGLMQVLLTGKKRLKLN